MMPSGMPQLGMENDELHTGGEHRRRPRGLSDDHLLLQFEFFALPDLAGELRDVVHHVERAEIHRQPAPTFHVGDEPIGISPGISPLWLAFAIERGARSVVQIAVGAKTVGLLKVANGVDELVIETPFIAGRFSGNLEPLTQKHDLVAFGTGLQALAVRQLDEQSRIDRLFFLLRSARLQKRLT